MNTASDSNMLDPFILVTSGPELAREARPEPDELLDAIRSAEAAQEEARRLAAIIELQSRTDASADLPEAAGIAVQTLQQLMTCSRVILAWRRDESSACRILADTHASEQHEAKGLTRLAEAAAEEAAVRAELTCWPPAGDRDRHALLAIEQFARAASVETVLAASLVDDQGVNRGAVLALNPVEPLQQETEPPEPDSKAATQLSLFDTVRGPLATKLAAMQRFESGKLESVVRHLQLILRRARRRVVLGAIVATAVVMLLPLRYRFSCDCELQPVERRFVAAPFDGPLQEATVRPGDLVTTGDLLAKINPRELEYELAGLRADLSRSRQEAKGLIAKHDVAGSKIATFESQRLQLQTELLEFRRENLEIRSPLDGVVISGDLRESEGTPLSRGETLFEIAPLGRVLVEVAIDESEFHQARQGMPVQFYVHAIPNRTFHGELERIHPRAELKDHHNVFIGEVVISDPENILRPGMKGRARISSDRHPLGWNLFHQAFESLRRALSF